jgi:hypothetical protein
MKLIALTYSEIEEKVFMKRTTALRYAVEIARRVHTVNGLLATPLCNFEAQRISRMWVFGSTAKGSENPSDLDLLIEMRDCGRHRTWQQGKLDKRSRRQYGCMLAIDSRKETLKWLTKGMRLVSRHTTDSEGLFHKNLIDVKKMIYPRFELDSLRTTRSLSLFVMSGWAKHVNA